MRLFLNPTPKINYLSAYSFPFRFRSPSCLKYLFPNLNSYTSISTIPTRVTRTSSTTTMAASTKPSSLSDNEQGMARRFWVKFRNESILALYTPFVVSLASGNLKLDTFRHYISQDLHFLKCFAQAYELAEECADDDDAKVSIRQLRKNVLEELKLHDSFVQLKELQARQPFIQPSVIYYWKQIPAVPVIFGLRNALFLEPPSASQLNFAKSDEEKRLHMTELEYKMLQFRKKKRQASEERGDSSDANEGVEDQILLNHALIITSARKSTNGKDKVQVKRKKAKVMIPCHINSLICVFIY